MLGARIAALRRDAGMSQAELAKRLQISPSAIGMYEQGRREPSAETLVAIARELGTSTDYLLTGRAATQAESEALQRLLLNRVDAAGKRQDARPGTPLSRQELAALFAALLLEP